MLLIYFFSLFTQAGRTMPLYLSVRLSSLDQHLTYAHKQVERCLILQRDFAKATLDSARDIDWKSAVAAAKGNVAPVSVDANHPLYVLYTSGTTGLCMHACMPAHGHTHVCEKGNMQTTRCIRALQPQKSSLRMFVIFNFQFAHQESQREWFARAEATPWPCTGPWRTSTDSSPMRCVDRFANICFYTHVLYIYMLWKASTESRRRGKI